MPRYNLGRVASLGAAALLAAASAFIWIRPLLHPREVRGDYLFGYYHLLNLYVGLPLLALTLAVVITVLAPERMRKVVGHRAFAVLLGALVPVILFDLGYSLFYIGALKPAFWLDHQHVSRQENVADDDLGFRRRPNITWEGVADEVEAAIRYRTDQNGFRNEPGLERADLAFVGDSYTEAAQVAEEDTFAARVGRKVKQSVVNLGRGAYGPPQELIVLERYALSYEPKTVFWQLFEGNDLGDAQSFVEWRDDPDRVAASLSERYVQNSFFKPFFDLTARLKHRIHVSMRMADGSMRDMRLRYRWVPDYAQVKERGLDATKAAILVGQRLCNERGARLVVFFIPIMARVNVDRLTFADAEQRARSLPDPSQELPPQWGDVMAQFCIEHEIPFIDLYPAFRAEAEKDPYGLYLPTDEHLDAKGHETVAKALVGWLESDS